jgi:hypothetical protein
MIGYEFYEQHGIVPDLRRETRIQEPLMVISVTQAVTGCWAQNSPSDLDTPSCLWLTGKRWRLSSALMRGLQ